MPPILGMYFRDGIQQEGAGDGPAVTIAEMERVNPDRKWMWRTYPNVRNTDRGDLGRIEAARSRNDPIYISWHWPYDFAAVAAGTFDADIRAAAVRTLDLIDAGMTVVVGYQHEPENDEKDAIPSDATRAARFVEAWTRTAELFMGAGVTKARLKEHGGFIVGPTLTHAYYHADRKTGEIRADPWLAMDPKLYGPLSVDAYTRWGSRNAARTQVCRAEWLDPMELYGPALDAAEARGKRLAILETGIHEDTRDPEFEPGRKAHFFDPLLLELARTGKLAAVCYSNVDAIFVGKWIEFFRVNTTPESDQSFAALSRDAVWRS